jgi:hypothetical protein
MKTPVSAQPLDSLQQMNEALQELDLDLEEARSLAPLLMQLKEWQAPIPTVAETEELVSALLPGLLQPSPVRRARRVRRRGLLSDLGGILELARTQVSILRPSFWLLSALVTLMGALLVLSRAGSDQALLLLAIGPLWSYLGTVSVFRSAELNVLELELACPPSPRQLMLARLVVMLGYDLLLNNQDIVRTFIRSF